MAQDLTAIVGAGALGAMYAGQIQRAGLPVAFVAEGARASRLKQNGVALNGKRTHIPVIPWDVPPVQRIIVAVKHHHLPEVCRRITALADGDTVVLSVMNGIDSEAALQEALDAAASRADSRAANGSAEPADSSGASPRGAIVLPAMAAGMDAVRYDDEVSYKSLGRIVFGAAATGTRSSAAVEQMRAFLERAGIPGVIPEDITHAVWNKFMLNVGINQWSAVLRAPYGLFHREGPARDLMRAAMREVLAVAEKRGVPLTEEDLEAWIPVVETLSAPGKTSMLQDVEARRKTEVEMFAGRVVEMGRELGVATPMNETLLTAIRAIEELYSASFASAR